MRKRMKEILRDRRASSFPMTIGIVLSLIILMCGISEYFRLQVIAAGVREAVEDAVISTVNDNYAGVYHGVREGYSGSYVPFGEGSWEEDLNLLVIPNDKLFPPCSIVLLYPFLVCRYVLQVNKCIFLLRLDFSVCPQAGQH